MFLWRSKGNTGKKKVKREFSLLKSMNQPLRRTNILRKFKINETYL